VRTERPGSDRDKSQGGLANLGAHSPQKTALQRINKKTESLVVRLALLLSVSTLLALSAVVGAIPPMPRLIVLVLGASAGFPRIIKRDGAALARTSVFLLAFAFGFLTISIVNRDFDGLFWCYIAAIGVAFFWMIAPRVFLAFFFIAALLSSMIAIFQPPLHGVHRWFHIGGLSFNAAQVLAVATVLLFASACSTLFRFICLSIGLACLIKSGSFTFAAVASIVCLLVLAAQSQWGECTIVLAITIVCLISPLALSHNRIVRLTDYVEGGSRQPYQIRQARSCMRELCYIGTSPAIRSHLPGTADDMSLLDFMIWGGTCVGALILGCHMVILACMWLILRKGNIWARNLGIAAMGFYSIILVVHILSNLTLIPSIGVSAPFQGRGLTNVIVGLVLVWIVSSAPHPTSEAGSFPNSQQVGAIFFAIALMTMCYIAISTVPLWVNILFSA